MGVPGQERSEGVERDVVGGGGELGEGRGVCTDRRGESVAGGGPPVREREEGDGPGEVASVAAAGGFGEGAEPGGGERRGEERGEGAGVELVVEGRE
jgi:hypothetical protein